MGDWDFPDGIGRGGFVRARDTLELDASIQLRRMKTIETKEARPVPLLDLRAQYATFRKEVGRAIERVLDSQYFILGEEVRAFEMRAAEYCGVRHAVGCASGSDALLLALLALEIGPGDEVITVPFTFFATAGAIVHAGAKPVFVDIEPDTFNMDAAQLERVLNLHPKARAILPVHLYGGCADMDAIAEAARARGIAVIEDAAQAIGSEYKGRRAGGLGELGCFSFFPSKNLGAFGDGGMVTTNDERLAERLRALRVHGSQSKYVYEWVGLNSRLDALQAAVLRVKIEYLDGWTEGRQRNAARYTRKFQELGAPVVTPVVTPVAAPYQTRHIYNQYTLLCPRRDELRQALAAQGIGTEIYYPLPLHLQKCFAALGYKAGDFPVSERCAREALSVPIYPELPAEDVDRVAEAVAAFYTA
jgi:dTDP-4-amino-4,6-dideoxygalactose transaminase